MASAGRVPIVGCSDSTGAAAVTTDATLRAILRDVLGLAPGQAESLTPDSGLFGSLPELDSMAVAGLLTEIEDRLRIVIDDDEVDGEMLETYGNLLAFAESKQQAALAGR
jgi:acyl carrier protein